VLGGELVRSFEEGRGEGGAAWGCWGAWLAERMALAEGRHNEPVLALRKSRPAISGRAARREQLRHTHGAANMLEHWQEHCRYVLVGLALLSRIALQPCRRPRTFWWGLAGVQRRLFRVRVYCRLLRFSAGHTAVYQEAIMVFRLNGATSWT
jgi:hypothetical protein